MLGFLFYFYSLRKRDGSERRRECGAGYTARRLGRRGDIYWSFTELETKTNELIDIESSEINEMWWVRFNEIYYDAGAIAEANAAAVENAQLSEVDTVLANNLSEIIALYVDAFELVKAAEAEKDDHEIVSLVFNQLKTNVADANSRWDRALLDATS